MTKNNKNVVKKPNGKKKSPLRNLAAGVIRTTANVVKKSNTKTGRQLLGSVRMSKCAGTLAIAIADPFCEEARGACFPMYPAPDSHKLTAFQRVDGFIGTAGVGFIALCPSVASDVPSAYYTNATFAGTTATILSATNTYVTGVTPSYYAAPYTAAQLIRSTGLSESTLSGRVVSVGLRLTYTGTNLNQSGLVTSLSHPVHSNLTGASAASLATFPQCNICAFTRKPCTLSLTPAATGEVSYPATNEASNTRLLYPFTGDYRFNTAFTGGTFYENQQTIDGVTVALGAPMAVMFCTGVPGSAFHFDLIHHLEYTGRDCASASTPNSVDVVSTYAILTAAHQLSTRKMAQPNKSDWHLLMDGIKAAMGSPVTATARGIGALVL